jgi:hypothetical protein
MQPLLHLPDWPARRLVTEAMIAYGLRHQEEEFIDYECAPWPLVRGAVLAFLRHQLTDYDSQLRARCEHDPAYRDELAKAIEQGARRQYPWLDSDPRPFTEPPGDDTLLLDGMAKELANLRTLREHFKSAAHDLRRSGAPKDQISELEAEAAGVSRQIERMYGMLVEPKVSPDGNYGHAFILARPGEDRYYFHDARPLPPNRLIYLGFKCPRCQASVVQRKGFIDFGQTYNRVVVWSCHCLTYAVYQPPRHKAAPITPEDWASFTQRNESSKS